MGWGYAEGSHILNELSRDDKLINDVEDKIREIGDDGQRVTACRKHRCGKRAEQQYRRHACPISAFQSPVVFCQLMRYLSHFVHFDCPPYQ